MTKVKIDPGICGFIAAVEATNIDEDEVKVVVKSGCQSILDMMKELGDTYDPFEVCLTKPGENNFFKFAAKNFPGHSCCPIISGIIKCVEVECNLALPKTSSITFE